MNQIYKAIELVPTAKIPPPWHLAIGSVQGYSPILLIPNQPLETHLAINEGIWLIALHWVFKKQCSKKHKIPACRIVASAVEPLGELLFRISQICKEVHYILPPSSTSYDNAAKWFACVAWESKRGDSEEICDLSDKKGRGKKAWVRSIWNEWNLLKEEQNPYELSHCPHTFKLVDEARKLVKNSDVFNDNYWKPLLKAYSEWARELDRNDNWRTFRVKNGKLVAQNGKGRGELLVPLLSSKSVC